MSLLTGVDCHLCDFFSIGLEESCPFANQPGPFFEEVPCERDKAPLKWGAALGRSSAAFFRQSAGSRQARRYSWRIPILRSKARMRQMPNGAVSEEADHPNYGINSPTVT